MNFKDAWKRRKKSKYGNIPITIISLEDLIISKKASGRDRDIIDLKKLKRAR